ncbi:hypothetical protein [Pontibacter sp. Tf4]|uniref:hypothetical protein n=1 Tax=Pontibacter sp. Tf4 TaxID=2761620 RepID=UPI001626B4E7|nr:hypothetical protein [Pontibacter sp. Tf4]
MREKKASERNVKPRASCSSPYPAAVSSKATSEKNLLTGACKGGKVCRIFALPTEQQAGAGKQAPGVLLEEKPEASKKEKKIFGKVLQVQKCFLPLHSQTDNRSAGNTKLKA